MRYGENALKTILFLYEKYNYYYKKKKNIHKLNFDEINDKILK